MSVIVELEVRMKLFMERLMSSIWSISLFLFPSIFFITVNIQWRIQQGGGGTVYPHDVVNTFWDESDGLIVSE
jgi:hypothetical protein